MALETMKGLKEIHGEKILEMDSLKETHPELFREDGSMKYEIFEKEYRPKYPIQIRHDKNSISFTIQNGPIKENGKNGCQLDSLVAVVTHMIRVLNLNYPSEYNSKAIQCFETGLFHLQERTRDRESRGVEGTSNV